MQQSCEVDKADRVSSADFGIFLHIFRVLRAKIEIDTFANRPPPARGANHGANNAKEPSCGLWPKRPVGNRVPLRRVRAGTAEEQGARRRLRGVAARVSRRGAEEEGRRRGIVCAEGTILDSNVAPRRNGR